MNEQPDCEAVELNDDGGSMGFPPPHHHDPDGGHSSSNQTRSVINFASAKNHVMKRAFQSKACRRAEDLKSMIDLDVVSYDILNLPPAGHFDTYIRSFARTDVKQVMEIVAIFFCLVWCCIPLKCVFEIMYFIVDDFFNVY